MCLLCVACCARGPQGWPSGKLPMRREFMRDRRSLVLGVSREAVSGESTSLVCFACVMLFLGIYLQESLSERPFRSFRCSLLSC